MRKYSSIFLSMLLAASISLAALLIVVVGVPVFAQDATGTNIGEVMQSDEYGIGGASLKDKYGECYLTYDLAQYICDLYHQETVATVACLYRDCFEMIYTDEARVAAGDEPKLFPIEWNAWHNGTLTSIEESCGLVPKNNKTQILIPEDERRCAAVLTTNEHKYYWHFASNPDSGCLAFLECQEY